MLPVVRNSIRFPSASCCVISVTVSAENGAPTTGSIRSRGATPRTSMPVRNPAGGGPGGNAPRVRPADSCPVAGTDPDEHGGQHSDGHRFHVCYSRMITLEASDRARHAVQPYQFFHVGEAACPRDGNGISKCQPTPTVQHSNARAAAMRCPPAPGRPARRSGRASTARRTPDRQRRRGRVRFGAVGLLRSPCDPQHGHRELHRRWRGRALILPRARKRCRAVVRCPVRPTPASRPLRHSQAPVVPASSRTTRCRASASASSSRFA